MAFKIPNFYTQQSSNNPVRISNKSISPINLREEVLDEKWEEGGPKSRNNPAQVYSSRLLSEKNDWGSIKELRKQRADLLESFDGRYDTFSGARNVLIDPNSESSRKMREAYKNDWGTDFDPSDENSMSYANSYYNSQPEHAKELMAEGKSHSKAIKESKFRRDNSFGHGNANWDAEEENVESYSEDDPRNPATIDPQNINWSEGVEAGVELMKSVAETETEPIEEVMSSEPIVRNNRRTRRRDRIIARNEKAELRNKGIKGDVKFGDTTLIDGKYVDQDFQDPNIS